MTVLLVAGVGAAAAVVLGLAAGTEPAGVAHSGTRTTAPVDVATTTTVPPTTTTTAPTTTTTTAPTTTTTAPVAPDTLAPGATGEAVGDLQHRLQDLGYWLGEPDGTYTDLTTQAVLAFQKQEGLHRDGIAGPVTLARLTDAGRPAPGRPDAVDHLEVDLERQVVRWVSGGQVQLVLNTSTGKPSTPTRPGDYSIRRVIDGVRHAPLGNLYRPMYFNGGIAIHGYAHVPAYAASHGCTRVSPAAMDLLWQTAGIGVGTPVWVA
jgi:hypothetical protein